MAPPLPEDTPTASPPPQGAPLAPPPQDTFTPSLPLDNTPTAPSSLTDTPMALSLLENIPQASTLPQPSPREANLESGQMSAATNPRTLDATQDETSAESSLADEPNPTTSTRGALGTDTGLLHEMGHPNKPPPRPPLRIGDGIEKVRTLSCLT